VTEHPPPGHLPPDIVACICSPVRVTVRSREVSGTVQLIGVSAYRPLSAFKSCEITDILKHDTIFAVCLFPAANGAMFEQKKLGFGKVSRANVRVKVNCRRSVSNTGFKDVIVTPISAYLAYNSTTVRFADALISYIRLG